MPATILLIDDHAETRQLVAITLEEHGYEVISAGTGDAGLALARQHTPDLVLLDVMMPERNGYDVCREMRRIPALTQTPIILFTARTQPSEKWEGFEAGANDYLIKPTRPAELLRRVGAQLRQTAAGPAAEQSDETPTDPNGTSPESEREWPRRQRLIVVAGSRGGSGSTLLAINVAALFAEMRQQTILVDLDGRQGHVSAYLQREHPGLEEWIGQASARPLLDRLLLTITSYWQLLLWNPEPGGEYVAPSARELQEILTSLLHPERTVIVDVGHTLTPAVQALIRQSDEVIFCMRPERVAVNAAKMRLPYLLDWVRPPARVHAVLMTFDERVQMATGAVENVLDRGLAASIAFDVEELVQVANNGRHYAQALPKSPTTQALRHLVERVATGARR